MMTMQVEDPPYHRSDHALILSLIPQQASVLDLGCGTGELLSLLIREKNVMGQGIELDAENVVQCLHKGLSVYHGDVDEGLRDYPNLSYDYVIVNLALQMFRKPAQVLQETLRVGRYAIVGFPNFGYWKIRWQLLSSGRMPTIPASNGSGLNKQQPAPWYSSPNIHPFTILDFARLCDEQGIRYPEIHCKMNNQWKSYRSQSTRIDRCLHRVNWMATESVFILGAD